MFIIVSFYVNFIYNKPALLMPLNPEIWFPHLKFTLQTIAIYYPKYPNDVTKKKYYDTIQNFPLFFPYKPIGNEFAKILDQYPVTPYLSSRGSFIKWIHFIINKISASMDWEQEDMYDSLEKYYECYKPKELINRNKYKRKKQYIMVGILGFIILSIFWFLK